MHYALTNIQPLFMKRGAEHQRCDGGESEFQTKLYDIISFPLLKTRNDKENLVVNLSLEFALDIIRYAELL
jgi:cobalamin biosynthesis Co2+ chelatase CbiK